MAKRRKRISRERLQKEKLIPLLPNIITTGSLTLGLASVMTSLNIVAIKVVDGYSTDLIYRKLWWAALFIGVAIVLDMLDGKLARMLGSESKFGVSYDSLSDLVSFGVAPGVLVYVWLLMDWGKLGLMALLFYIVCVALRLARFNIQSNDVEKYNFTGLPSPMGAGLMFSPALLFSEFRMLPSDEFVWFYLLAAPIIGLVMVSDIPYNKLPQLKMRGQFNILVIAAIIITAVISNPAIMITMLAYSYFFFGIVMFLIKHAKKEHVLDSTEEAAVESNN